MSPIIGLSIAAIVIALCSAVFPNKPKQKVKTDDQKFLELLKKIFSQK